MAPSPANSGASESERLYGVVEADEAFFLKSEKGCKKLTKKPRFRGEAAAKRGVSREQVSVLVAIDRNDNEADYMTGFWSVNSKWLEENFTVHLDEEPILVTDSAKSFNSFCRRKCIEHISVNPSQGIRIKGVFHIQHVNSYHRLLKKWMDRFNGVETKYLGHYLG